jgi:DNA-binding response OmpR family regulator
MKKCVMIVDDDESIRKSVTRVLQEADYDVLCAGDGREAIDQFASHAVDLLILDLNLPIRKGWDVFEEMTHMDPFVPVIIITGLSNQFAIARAAGAGALLEKPVDPLVLLKTIRDLSGEPNSQRLRRLIGYTQDTRYAPPSNTLLVESLRQKFKTPYLFQASDARQKKK